MTGMNPSHRGSDEQMFGSKQQVGELEVELPMNGVSTREMTAALLRPLKFSRLRTRAPAPSCSDFGGSRQARVNPRQPGSDEQMFGSKQQVLHRGLVD